MDVILTIAKELSINQTQVESAVKLLDEGNTVPFIARYRKEVTGSLDDNQLRDLSERLIYLRNLDKRREDIKASIDSQGALTEELIKAIDKATKLSSLEDLYLPFKKKRKTRASVAKEKGLLPLAELFLEQTGAKLVAVLAEPFVDEEKGVATVEDAIAGASDIIAEMVSDDAVVRGALRTYLWSNALIKSVGSTVEEGVYSMYYDFTESIAKIAGYRILALDRGEREGILKVTIDSNDDMLLAEASRLTVKKGFSPSISVVKLAVQDSLKRLISPSLEREIRSDLTERAATQAIKVFALNLKPLFMQPPLKGKVTMGFDPGYRTGCKIAVVDELGKVLETGVVYPTMPKNDTAGAGRVLKGMISRHGITAIAIGNGTASKESEIFIAALIKEVDTDVSYMVVSEAGASVYSASKLAAEEFPEYDVSLRSAVSIARRLQDPLAELVKIDPKAIGVGQYQHDMPKAQLDLALTGVVEDCVNSVGVDVNTASFSLLSYVAGIGPALAKNMVLYREETGGFADRKELLKVSKLGKKAYEQCAGFLRVSESENPLDNTAVHPESYTAAKKLLKICGFNIKKLNIEELKTLPQKIAEIGESVICEQLEIGLPTLQDMTKEILKPGRDPRDELPPPVLRSDLLELSDLKPDMVLDGTVRNVVDFGAFIDIGVHQDGLVHISRICDKFLKHPSEAVRVGDIVRVKVLEIDAKRKRISLTMKDL